MLRETKVLMVVNYKRIKKNITIFYACFWIDIIKLKKRKGKHFMNQLKNNTLSSFKKIKILEGFYIIRKKSFYISLTLLIRNMTKMLP